tara:strand:- start:901 stop:1233 length:333 start_codon:yes stop_codon:yes gene_type:complete
METTQITADQFDQAKGMARGGRGPSEEVAKVRTLKIGEGVQFPASTFMNEDNKHDEKARQALGNRILGDATKNEYHVRTKRPSDHSLLVLRISPADAAKSKASREAARTN